MNGWRLWRPRPSVEKSSVQRGSGERDELQHPGTEAAAAGPSAKHPGSVTPERWRLATSSSRGAVSTSGTQPGMLCLPRPEREGPLHALCSAPS